MRVYVITLILLGLVLSECSAEKPFDKDLVYWGVEDKTLIWKEHPWHHETHRYLIVGGQNLTNNLTDGLPYIFTLSRLPPRSFIDRLTTSRYTILQIMPINKSYDQFCIPRGTGCNPLGHAWECAIFEKETLLVIHDYTMCRDTHPPDPQEWIEKGLPSPTPPEEPSPIHTFLNVALGVALIGLIVSFIALMVAIPIEMVKKLKKIKEETGVSA